MKKETTDRVQNLQFWKPINENGHNYMHETKKPAKNLVFTLKRYITWNHL